MQFKLRINKMTQNVNSTFSPDQSVLNFRSSAQLLRGCSAADASPALRRSTLPRPVYESSFWTSKEVHEASHNRRGAADGRVVLSVLSVVSTTSQSPVSSLHHRRSNTSLSDYYRATLCKRGICCGSVVVRLSITWRSSAKASFDFTE